MAKYAWTFSPDSGGQKIPDAVKRDITQRIEAYAAAHFAGNYTHPDIRFRGQFYYIDAYTDEKWGFAFFTYSNKKYSLATYANGEFFGQPEEAFRLAAQAYLA